MSITALIEDGYVVHRPASTTNVDCAPLRQIDNHARHLARLLSAIDVETTEHADAQTIQRELQRAGQWLSMAAGLQSVKVERLPDDGTGWICGSAWRYYSAHNDLASDFATEQLRLMYAWSALERLLKVIHLPNAPLNAGPFVRAAHLLDQSFATGCPVHYGCIAKHLAMHLRADAALSLDPRLVESVLAEGAHHRPGSLILAGHQLRHIPAHGDADVPVPVDWDEEEAEVPPRLNVVLHAPRLAARGLLLSLQMLLSSCSAPGTKVTWETPEGGWWIVDADNWERHLEPMSPDLLLTAHLDPPEPDDQVNDDEEDSEDL